jgi:hypothetical protein
MPMRLADKRKLDWQSGENSKRMWMQLATQLASQMLGQVGSGIREKLAGDRAAEQAQAGREAQDVQLENMMNQRQDALRQEQLGQAIKEKRAAIAEPAARATKFPFNLDPEEFTPATQPGARYEAPSTRAAVGAPIGAEFPRVPQSSFEKGQEMNKGLMERWPHIQRELDKKNEQALPAYVRSAPVRQKEHAQKTSDAMALLHERQRGTISGKVQSANYRSAEQAKEAEEAYRADLARQALDPDFPQRNVPAVRSPEEEVDKYLPANWGKAKPLPGPTPSLSSRPKKKPAPERTPSAPTALPKMVVTKEDQAQAVKALGADAARQYIKKMRAQGWVIE